MTQKSQQKTLAIYHLLKVAANMLQKATRTASVLRRIKRIELLNEILPTGLVLRGDDMDAVRVMTIHEAKARIQRSFPAIQQIYPAVGAVHIPHRPHFRSFHAQDGHHAEESVSSLLACARAR